MEGGKGGRVAHVACPGLSFSVLACAAQLCLVDKTCVAYKLSQTGDVLFYVVGAETEVPNSFATNNTTSGADTLSELALCAAPTQNELILAHVLDAMFDAVASLLKYQVEKMILIDNIELLLLTIDELCDGG